MKTKAIRAGIKMFRTGEHLLLAQVARSAQMKEGEGNG